MTAKRVAFGAALAAILLMGAAPAPARPQRVMSLNACTDQLLLQLVPPERIRSVSYLALRNAVSPQVAQAAAKVAVNHGLAEEIAAQKPDLILAEPFTSTAARRLARQAGIPVLDIDPAANFDDIRRTTRQVAAAVGERARGEALIARMDATLEGLARTAPVRPITAVGWNGGGSVPGKATLFNAILTAAGGTNVAAAPGFRQRSFTLESLLALTPRPQLLLYGKTSVSQPGLEAEAVRHPVLQQAYAGRRVVYPEAAFDCGAPQAADAAVALRAQMLRAVAGTQP